MKKYFIVLILGLFLGCLFARSAYCQENYFTPGQTMKALQESEENSEVSGEGEKVKGKGVNDFYFEQFTDSIEVIEGYNAPVACIKLENVKYEDVYITLYFHKLFLNGNDYKQVTSVIILINTWYQINRDNLIDILAYCALCGYEDTLTETFEILIGYLETQINLINEHYAKFDQAYEENNFGICVEQVLNIQNRYWSLYTAIAEYSNEMKDSTNKLTLTFIKSEE